MFEKFKKAFLGDAKNPLDAGIFHQLALAAFLAWVGLGADGLSSSAYGPEEAYVALGHGHEHMALLLAIATAFTVLLISASYNQIIELFPSGGGGYVVSSKLLGERAGLVCGSALVVDYILTVAISMAAGADAVFSNLPKGFLSWKLEAAMMLTLLLIWLNMRGLKESIKVLLPIFLVFVATHLLLIGWGIGSHTADLPGIVVEAVDESREMISSKGFFAFMALLLTAYSLGGGTYTGIEAVANGMNTLAEPKVRTGKRTMLYMALSLAFTAAGILICYMLFDIRHEPGKTMNASLIYAMFKDWPMSGTIISVTLWSEALLLFIAAQAGFVAGPTVLSNMAVDSWLPHRFANLSNRLVRQNGILFMGVAALLILWFTKGKVTVLVVLYSINVFITFSLSQLSMCIHWWRNKAGVADWQGRFAINGLGFLLTTFILVVTTVIKFGHGGWATLVITGAFVAGCMVIKGHYQGTRNALKRLDDMLIDLPFPEAPPQKVTPEPQGPTAVLLVNGWSGLGIHAIFSIRKLFKHQEFKNLVFIHVGRIDSAKFKGVEEIENLRESVESDLKRYVDLAARMGYASEFRYSLGTDVPTEISKICERLADDYVEPVFFSAKLIFARENWINRFLHNQTSLELQRRLLFQGQNMIVLPIRVL